MSKTLPLISLNCIVKNEAKVIERMLRSVKPLIDYYIIIDTGSTDDTKRIIKETMDELGIPGEIHDHEWIDFCTARNFALSCLKGKSEYGFWIDADEQLVLKPGFNRSTLIQKLRTKKIDQGSTEVIYGSQKYFRSQLFKVDIDWEWVGAVHEVMMPPSDYKINPSLIEGFYTLVKPEGNSWGDGTKETQRQKYLQHAQMLEEYIKKNKDPRWIFYLAQSYRDAFEYEKAEEWYRRRVLTPGGYWEELYFSQIMVAAMQAKQQKPVGVILESYMQAGKFDPNRCEHIIPSIKHYQSTKNFPVSYMLSKYCYTHFKTNPFPKSTLFIDNGIYDYQILDLHAVNCYYMGKFEEARTTYNKLKKQIQKGLVPEDISKRILSNERWYTKKLHNTLKTNKV